MGSGFKYSKKQKKANKELKQTDYGKALYEFDDKKGARHDISERMEQAGRSRGLSGEEFYNRYAEGKKGGDLKSWSKTLATDEAFDLLDPGAARAAPETKFGAGFEGGAKKKSKQRRTLLTGNEGLATPAATFRKTLLGQ